jgi:hypothetical protein
MANDDHIAQLSKGVPAWNAWRLENRKIKVDLREVGPPVLAGYAVDTAQVPAPLSTIAPHCRPPAWLPPGDTSPLATSPGARHHVPAAMILGQALPSFDSNLARPLFASKASAARSEDLNHFPFVAMAVGCARYNW